MRLSCQFYSSSMQQIFSMQGSQSDIGFDQKLTYSLASQRFNKPLEIINHSDHTYVFKIRTNQPTVVILQLSHDFIKPHSQKQIGIKFIDKPHEITSLKLQVSYAIPSDEDFHSKNSQMTSYPKQSIFKKIIRIERDDNEVKFKSNEIIQQKKQSPKKKYSGIAMTKLLQKIAGGDGQLMNEFAKLIIDETANNKAMIKQQASKPEENKQINIEGINFFNLLKNQGIQDETINILSHQGIESLTLLRQCTQESLVAVGIKLIEVLKLKKI